jgi:hypothetical protein
MTCHKVWYIVTNISERHAAFIYRTEGPILTVDTAYSYEKVVLICRTTGLYPHYPEGGKTRFHQDVYNNYKIK